MRSSSRRISLTVLTNRVYKWENGNVRIKLDGTPASFLADLNSDFDTTLYPNACTAGGSTQFAGPGIIALYHTDNAPAGAPGFQSTSNWQLVKCSALNPPAQGGSPKKQPAPSDVLALCTPDNNDGKVDRCEIVTTDVLDATGCGGNCQDEIVTTINFNLDIDCNAVKDTNFDADVCLYWEAQKPSVQPVGQNWNGNLQARVNGGNSGDKTANFVFQGPNAVTLRDLKANSLAGLPAVAIIAGVLILGAAAVFYRRGLRRA